MNAIALDQESLTSAISNSRYNGQFKQYPIRSNDSVRLLVPSFNNAHAEVLTLIKKKHVCGLWEHWRTDAICEQKQTFFNWVYVLVLFFYSSAPAIHSLCDSRLVLNGK